MAACSEDNYNADNGSQASTNRVSDEVLCRFYGEISPKQKIRVLRNLATDEEKLEAIGRSCPGYEQYGNALIYAVCNNCRSHACQLLNIIKKISLENKWQVLLDTNSVGCNFFRVLVEDLVDVYEEIHPSQRLLEKCLRYLQSVGSQALKSPAKDKHSVLTFAAQKQCKSYPLLMEKLLDVLSPEEKKMELLELHFRSEQKHGDVQGYNLLMLALEGYNGVTNGNAVQAILDIAKVSTFGKAEREKMALEANGKPSHSEAANADTMGVMPHSGYRNSVILSAERKEFVYLFQIVSECVGEKKRCLSLVQTHGQERRSALGEMIKEGEWRQLEKFLADDQIKQSLKEMLSNKAFCQKFLSQPMSLAVINKLYEAKIFTKTFILPMPSKLCKPRALIFHNPFDYTSCEDHRTRKELDTHREATALKRALKKLGWKLKTPDVISRWTFQEMLKILRNRLRSLKASETTSLFMLFISSHGKNDFVYGHKSSESGQREQPSPVHDLCCYTEGEIKRIKEVVHEELDVSTPKVLVIDVCRKIPVDSEPNATVLDRPNMLMLFGTLPGHTMREGTYLVKLAEQIRQADGNTTIVEMHEAASRRSFQEEKQIPMAMSSNMKDIILYNWRKNHDSCVECQQPTSRQRYVTCATCSCRVCETCAGFSPDNELLKNEHIDVICSSCRRNRDQR